MKWTSRVISRKFKIFFTLIVVALAGIEKCQEHFSRQNVRGIACHLRFSTADCGIHCSQCCNSNETFMPPRLWVFCGRANVCNSCVTCVDKGQPCTLHFHGKDGHYKICPNGSSCVDGICK